MTETETVKKEENAKKDYTDQCMMECFELCSCDKTSHEDVMEKIKSEENFLQEEKIRQEYSLFFEHYKKLLDEMEEIREINWKERCMLCSQNNRQCPYYRIKDQYLTNGNGHVDDYCQDEICKNYQKLIRKIINMRTFGRVETALINRIIKKFDDCKFNTTYGHYESCRCRHYSYIKRLRKINSTCNIFDKIIGWVESLFGRRNPAFLENENFLKALSEKLQNMKNKEEKMLFIEQITEITNDAKKELANIKEDELTQIPKMIERFIEDLVKVSFVLKIEAQSEEILKS